MSCHKKKKRLSSLPPPCYHRKPIPFYCPRDGWLPPEPRPRRSFTCCRPSYPPLICRSKPEDMRSPPTVCIAGRCPQPSHPESYYYPTTPKILPPPSCVRFCVRYTNEGSCYYPSYWCQLPKCPTSTC